MNSFYRRVSLGAAIGTIVLGLCGISGWVSANHAGATFGAHYIPMAPLTAFQFLILGGALLARVLSPSSRRVRAFMLTSSWLVLALVTVKLLEFFAGVHAGMEEALIRDPAIFGSVPTARISPITVLFFLSSGLEMLFLAYGDRRRNIVAMGACAVMLMDGVILLGYLYQTPLLYGGLVIPVALTTALAFLILQAGIAAVAGPQAFPFRLFVGSSARALLLRRFLPLAFIFTIVDGLFHQLFSASWNPALLAAVSGLAAGGVMIAIIPNVAWMVGSAIDRAEEDRRKAENALERAHQELIQAYDTTLEGWARALDLRDKGTEGHCRRVVELTVLLAQAFGFKEDDLVHVRRGALLHDIGKMGLPDSVLLKPGPLTEEEWPIMRRHPDYAYQLLHPIEYLRRCLDIPYCHHEHWDGSGYPRGLKGAEIPLASRLFSVVDIWDALVFERPYHKPWPEAKVREYLQSLAGTHLDPAAVDAFLKLNLHEHLHTDAQAA